MSAQRPTSAPLHQSSASDTPTSPQTPTPAYSSSPPHSADSASLRSDEDGRSKMPAPVRKELNEMNLQKRFVGNDLFSQTKLSAATTCPCAFKGAPPIATSWSRV